MSRMLCLFALLGFADLAPGAEVRGILERIDPARKELVLEARGPGVRGAMMTFAVADAVEVTVGQKAAKLTDLMVGRRVRLTYEARDGKPTVTAIHMFDLLGTLRSLQEPTVRPAAPPAAPAEGLTGTLRRVAITEREIILATPESGQEKYTVLPVPADARILRDGKAIAFDELREEEAATVRAETRDGKPVAATIQVGTASPAAPAPPEARGANLRMLLQLLEQLRKRPMP